MNDKPDEPANSGGPEQVDSAAAQQQAEAAESTQAALQQLAELKAENAELRDKLLRTMAEMENLRRRTEREKADTAKYAISDFARDTVSIGDHLRRAIEAAQKEPLEHNPALKRLLEGVEVTERDLFKVLERHGITRFDPLGEKFDPHQHEAMVKVDVPGVPADIVVQVLHAGYKIGDRVLRPAAVIVAKGGTPARPPEPAGEEGAPETESVNGAPEGEEGPGGGAARSRPSSMHINVMRQRERDPDVLRGPGGGARGFYGPARGKDRVWPEKRGPTVTRPINEDNGSLKKDDLVSSFGKRLDNGN
jgi:molecular chaperone GrpE